MPDPVRPRPDPIAALVERWGVMAKEHAQMDSRRPADIEGAEHFRAAAVYQQCSDELKAALRADADARPPQEKENRQMNDANVVRQVRASRRPSDDAFRFFTGGAIELMRLSRADALRVANDILELAHPEPPFPNLANLLAQEFGFVVCEAGCTHNESYVCVETALIVLTELAKGISASRRTESPQAVHLCNHCEQPAYVGLPCLHCGKADAVPRRAEPPPEDMRAKYQELLYAVGKKYPGESRHETALRYIRQAEQSTDTQAANAAGGTP